MDKIEFEMRKKLIELEKKAKLEVEEIRHNNKMKEQKAERDFKLEVQRVRSAEIKRTIEKKRNARGDEIFAREYAEQINKNGTRYQP